VVWDLVDVGPNHVCGLTNQRDIWCFGTNKFGQFGTGVDSTVGTSAPQMAVDRLDPLVIVTLLTP
jgi:alpha-tubulin suppressor-like RCC1 family protein